MPGRHAVLAEILEAVKMGSKTAPETAFKVFSNQQRAGLAGQVLSQGKRSVRRNSLTEIRTKKTQS